MLAFHTSSLPPAGLPQTRRHLLHFPITFLLFCTFSHFPDTHLLFGAGAYSALLWPFTPPRELHTPRAERRLMTATPPPHPLPVSPLRLRLLLLLLAPCEAQDRYRIVLLYLGR